MGKKTSDNPRVAAGLVEDNFEQQPSDEVTAAGEAIDVDAIQDQVDAQAAAGGIQNPYASPEEQGMELTPKTFGPPQYGSPDPATAASRLATLEDGHPLDPGLLPEGHPAAISDDYAAETAPGEEGAGDEAEVDATDAAVALAKEQEVNLAEVEGTGENGRITKGDVEDYIDARDNA